MSSLLRLYSFAKEFRRDLSPVDLIGKTSFLASYHFRVIPQTDVKDKGQVEIVSSFENSLYFLIWSLNK
jgi:hypothetical protein